jgi:hypothetical protein
VLGDPKSMSTMSVARGSVDDPPYSYKVHNDEGSELGQRRSLRTREETRLPEVDTSPARSLAAIRPQNEPNPVGGGMTGLGRDWAMVRDG